MRTRKFVVNRDEAGQPLVDVLRRQLRLSRADALHAIRERLVRVDGKVWTQAARQVRVGNRVEIQLAIPAKKAQPVELPKAPAAARGIEIRHVDAQVIVVEKPGGMTTVRHADDAKDFGNRARRFLPATLVDLLPGLLATRDVKSKARVRAVHRLDKETSGLVVLARTAEAETHLGRQFRTHTVGRRYLAIVRGQAADQRLESHVVPDRGDHRRGSSATGEGQRAVTHVHVIERLGDYTLVECRLETGRTHQVRIHLGEAGTPLCGEGIYDRPLHGKPLPDASGAQRPMLHAATLEFEHPKTGEKLTWTSPLPRDMKELLERLRR